MTEHTQTQINAGRHSFTLNRRKMQKFENFSSLQELCVSKT